MLVERWSPLARITVYPTVWWTNDPTSPFGWGLSKSYQSASKIDQYWIEQDGSAGTPITRFDGDFSKVSHLQYDITALGYYLRSPQNVFVIGAGGGGDVLTALSFGAKKVVAWDINPVTVDVVQHQFNAFAGSLYNRADVDVRVM